MQRPERFRDDAALRPDRVGTASSANGLPRMRVQSRLGRRRLCTCRHAGKRDEGRKYVLDAGRGSHDGLITSLRPGISAYSMERTSISRSPTETTSPAALPIGARAMLKGKSSADESDP